MLVGKDPLDPDLGTATAHLGDFTVYRTADPPLADAQVRSYEHVGPTRVVVRGALRDAELLDLERVENRDDFLRFRVTPSNEATLLFVSQQSHPQWQARSEGRQLETVVVNDFYQGVIVPAHARGVELRSMPYVRWSWVPQLFFVVSFAAFGVRRLSRALTG